MSNRFPVPPSVVVRVVQAAADPDTDAGDLAKLLESDPVLSAKLLRYVNSASFSLRHKVASVDRAVAVMGMRALRNLALSVGVRGLIPAETFSEFPLEVYWEFSLRRAAAAQCLAERLELSQVEEFFTLGLCQDIGVLAKLVEDPSGSGPLAAAMREPADARLKIEQASGDGHTQVGHEMFTEWNFPEEITVPMLHHHSPEAAPEEFRQRTEISHAAEAIADLTMIRHKRLAMQTSVERMGTLGIDESEVGPVVDRVNQLASEFATLIGIELESQTSSEEIIALAYEGLAELNLSYEELTRRLQESLAEQERMAEKLTELNTELARQAHTDSLTGLPNRRSFDVSLGRELAIAARHGSPISLLIFDVDHFKQLNDTHGHPAGDKVLQAIGERVLAQVRVTDVAARHGGEEFALILPFTDREGGKIAAERFRSSMENLVVPWEGTELRFTVSVGGATLANVQHPGNNFSKTLFEMADRALYEAKGGGRNRCRWTDSNVPAPSAEPAPV